MVRSQPGLSKALMYASLAPRRAAIDASEEAPHSVGEVAQSLLLHRLRTGRQPGVFGTDLSQLGALLVVPRAVTAWPPKSLLLHGEIPYEPRMPAMFQQPNLLSWRRQQSEPRHTSKVATATDTSPPHALL